MLTLLLLLAARAGTTPEPGPVEEVLAAELDRAMEVLEDRPEPPHYVALSVRDREQLVLSARSGTLATATPATERLLDVDVRVGTPALDSTHELRGFSALEDDDRWRVRVPLEPDPGFALHHAVWRELDERYRAASERIVMIRANRSVKVEEEDQAPDFVPRDPVVDRLEVPALAVDQEAWEEVLVEASRRMEDSPAVHRGHAGLTAERVVKTFVDTEGTRLVHGRTHYRVRLSVEATAPDGDEVSVFESTDVHDAAGLPSPGEVLALAGELSGRLEALVAAPRGTPYSGPVLLSGRAAAVFFHEIFGHRVEGHRQKSEEEGKTFAEYVGRSILPEFIDVYDDPTLAEYDGQDLEGHYAYDDEGVPAQRAELVQDGVFVGFLMGRTPIEGFVGSNGHGRRGPGHPPTSRMGNTVIEAEEAVSGEELRALLLQEVRAQGLEYGYVVEEIEGGFTQTGRVTPNAFNVRAVATRRVFADGRPDELVRGIDLVGTPLVAFGTMVAAGDDPEVFNGSCGAESGWVPVSAVAPPLLFRHLEFQLKERGQERPPLLPKPTLSHQEARR